LILCFTTTVLAKPQQTQTQDATESKPTPAIYNGNDMVGYIYHGCYNETTELEGTGGGTRALYMGKSDVKPGEMTVQKCLSFCKTAIEGGYKFAGLEYAKECWCAQQLLSLSAKLDDAQCTLPCDGDKSQICGDALKLTV
ncbi:WSC domain containing protein, partial [Naviculisporaceae sp. PSN 640]